MKEIGTVMPKTLVRGTARDIRQDSPASDIIEWSLERFAHLRMAITTSFGMEGCALIDMYARHQQPMTVIYLDTMFFFEETYQLRDELIQRYPHLDFVNRGTSLTPDEQEERHGKDLWVANSDLCCNLRKVEPMRDAVADIDVWITGLRRSQSENRANMIAVEWDWTFQLLKVNPLAAWERQDVWEYVKTNDVPYNKLHEQGYPSIGCTHCTKPVDGYKVGEYTRAGRWNGTTKTECGLHGYGI
jgi:phosphoadenosine phosphosulfate reductase